MYQQINQYVQSCINLTDAQVIFFNNLLVRKVLPKKHIMLSEGEICNFEAFIIRGCVKTYFIDKNGFEIILTFATENWWISDVTSFNDQKPSKLFIETIEETEILLLSPRTKEELLQQIPAFERMFRLLIQRHLGSYQERLFSNIALTAEERYAQFLQKYPQLPQRIPQHLIASYLGISAEFLSRIRKRKKNN